MRPAQVFGLIEVLGIGGLGAACYGIAQWSPAAAWVFGGLCAMALSVAAALRKRGT